MTQTTSSELSQQIQTAVQIVTKPPAPRNGTRFTIFEASRPCGPAGWLAMLLIKAGNVKTNTCPSTNTQISPGFVISAINKYMV